MPTYVYKFIDTGETIEVQQSFSDNALTEAVHPGTGATMPVKKVYLPVGVTFKGGGFYKTDSRNGSSKSSATTAATNGSTSGDSSTSTPSTASSSESSSSAAPAAPAAAPAKPAAD
jgi:predicted nucleic acid-binding Zn ribbon protein